MYIPAIVCCAYSVNEQRQTNCFCCSGRFFVVVRVVLRSCVVTDVNALTVMLSYETPRRTGNTFSCLTTRIPRRLLFTLPGKSFMLSKLSLCQGKFCEKTNKRVKRLFTIHLQSVNESVSQWVGQSAHPSYRLTICQSALSYVCPLVGQSVNESVLQSVSPSDNCNLIHVFPFFAT